MKIKNYLNDYANRSTCGGSLPATPFDSPEESLIADFPEINSPEQLTEDIDIMMPLDSSAIDPTALKHNDKKEIYLITGVLGLLFMACYTFISG